MFSDEKFLSVNVAEIKSGEEKDSSLSVLGKGSHYLDILFSQRLPLFNP
jgi:hypothetical protein